MVTLDFRSSCRFRYYPYRYQIKESNHDTTCDGDVLKSDVVLAYSLWYSLLPYHPIQIESTMFMNENERLSFLFFGVPSARKVSISLSYLASDLSLSVSESV